MIRLYRTIDDVGSYGSFSDFADSAAALVELERVGNLFDLSVESEESDGCYSEYYIEYGGDHPFLFLASCIGLRGSTVDVANSIEANTAEQLGFIVADVEEDQ